MLFDHLAAIYGLALRVFQVSKDEVIELLNLTPGDIVLDIGGGTGVGARAAVDTAAAKGLVVDLSGRMLRQGTQGPQILRVQGDAQRLPLPDASVDAVLCLDALHHFRRPVAALVEARRVLRPGGTVLIEELDATRPSMRLISALERAVGEPGKFWSAGEMSILLESAGLSTPRVVNGGSVYYAMARRGHEAA